MRLYKSVLLAVNPDHPQAQQQVVKAGVIASHHQADYFLGYVEPGAGEVSFLDIELQLEEAHNAQQQKRMKQLSELAQHSPLPVRAIHLADGDIAAQITKLAHQVKAELVIIGRTRHEILWLNDLHHHLAQKLDCDLLVIR
ncbi:universal stress protein [Photobacterium sp. GJ3]|uniref:universal stress protein n=1 Tax=Photobacterium sp. GJ3 TaxID=2829502 RepID=UPI001B8BC3C6|nr:universal stress protein [Photobacterium sp. GJ3]QUJ67447.1 universal stress protein [Photobacterium sp. GJ3]